MKLVKTDKGKAELQPGVRTLGQRERSLLLLVDKHKSMADIAKILGSDIQSVADALVLSGYLVGLAPEGHANVGLAKLGDERQTRVPAAVQSVPSVLVSTDQFEGKRSLATTRMFLFDICERMFARSNPVLADVFRNALRDAKDRETMLAAGREMIAEIERVAGSDRADSISERIAMMLPVEALAAAAS